MDFDLKAINDFFNNYQNSSMPDSLRKLVLSGSEFYLGDLRTFYLRAKDLRGWMPEIVSKLDVGNVACDIPAMRDCKTPVYHVYNPYTGDYLGSFDIELASKRLEELIDADDPSIDGLFD